MEQIDTSSQPPALTAQARLRQAEELIIRTLKSSHLTDESTLAKSLKQYKVSDTDRLTALHNLRSQGKVMTSQNDKGEMMYKYLDESSHSRLIQMSQEHQLIYQKIVEAHDKGITSGDLKNKLAGFSFNATIINKALKDMEKSGHIKKMPSIQQKHKIVFMCIEVEPSSEVTGGLVTQKAFSEDSFGIILQKVQHYLKQNGEATLRDLELLIKPTLGSDQKDEHIRQIIDVLEIDQVIEKVGDTLDTYKQCGVRYPYQLQYTSVPCAYCPVRSECGPGNVINPDSCEYLSQW